MPERFHELALTPAVAAEQIRYYGRAEARPEGAPRDPLGEVERGFIEARDSFYMATISENGWPYLQHRGGAPGFLRVLEPNVLGFADLRGNRQMLSTGNLARNDRVALFLMDYPQRSRLKILGHARIMPAATESELAARLAPTGARGVERLVRIDVEAFDWNCPKFITPRYTRQEIEALVAPLKARITELETQLRRPPG
jgi:predicted pyridoxine 5'-phosphate oxidase superfamily flavin-nucleotide-binding protein